jgi:D-erythronate 2-dehydrogenase
MHILIIGAAGMIGAKLTQKLAKEPVLAGKDITKMTLVDVVAPKVPQALESMASASSPICPSPAPRSASWHCGRT